MSWNSYPSYVCNVILRKLRERKKTANGHCSDSEDDDAPRIWFRMPYIGPIGEKFAKKCISKLRNCFKKELKFILMYDTKKVAFFALTRTLYLSIYNHTSYINFNVPDVRRKIQRKRKDALLNPI